MIPEGSGITPLNLDDEVEKELAAARLKEEPRIKAQSKGDIQKARRILLAQLEQRRTKPDLTVPVFLKNGTRRYGTKDAAILFRANGTVSLILRSTSLKAEIKNVASRLGAFDKTGRMKSMVFELAFPDACLNLPSFLTAVNALLSEHNQNKFERKRDELVRQINAAWAIRHKVSIHHHQFLVELKEFAQELGQPPTKGELARKLGLWNNAQRMSQLCRELGFDWLPNDKPGPKTSRWKRRKK